MSKKKSFSKISLILCMLFMATVFFKYYPKWNNSYTEATLSWDISGYYLYLPAVFIYKDLKKLRFMDDIIKKYHPTPDFQQATKHWNGNYIMKYSCGLAIQYSPFFAIAHIYALNSEYPADGFSKPYQFMISLGSLLMAFLGLFYLRKVLLEYFEDKIVGIGLITLVLATNYFDYSTITGAHSHSWLFTLYAILIFNTIKFYRNPSFKYSMIIGGLIGLIALTRPTDIVACIIPVFWGLKNIRWESIYERFNFIKLHLSKFIISGLIALAIGFCQLLYWKIVGQEWLIFSYKGESFNFLSPNIFDAWFSYKSGWLVYTPVMFLSLIGLVFLYKRKDGTFISILSFFLIFNYIVFSWWNWWYGGSLGQRTMVQIYPLLMFPICALLEHVFSKNKMLLKTGIISLIVVCSYYNLWLTHQAHKGGLLMPGHMTKPYFWASLGKYSVDENVYKLLDTDEIFKGQMVNNETIFFEDFETTTLSNDCDLTPIYEQQSLCLGGENKQSQIYKAALTKDMEWSRAKATFRIKSKEWTMWQMTQLVLFFYKNDIVESHKIIRLQRLLQENETKEIYIDSQIPENIDSIGVQIINGYSSKPIMIDNLSIEVFNEY